MGPQPTEWALEPTKSFPDFFTIIGSGFMQGKENGESGFLGESSFQLESGFQLESLGDDSPCGWGSSPDWGIIPAESPVV